MLQRSSEKQLLEAAISAITASSLADWNPDAAILEAQSDEEIFEKYHEALGTYGRWICWTLFSVGAENLVKASCMSVKFGPTDKSLGYKSQFSDHHHQT